MSTLFTTQQAKTLAGLKAAVDESIRIHGCEMQIECEIDVFDSNAAHVGTISSDPIPETE